MQLSHAGHSLADGTAPDTVKYLNQSFGLTFDVPNHFYDNAVIESALATAKTDEDTAYLFSDGKSSINIRRRMTMLIKNGGQTAAKVQYVKFMCKSYTTIPIMTQLDAYLKQHGHTAGIGTIHSKLDASANNSEIPSSARIQSNEKNISFLGHVGDLPDWKKIGKVVKFTLQPGDETTIVHDAGEYKYQAFEGDSNTDFYQPNLFYGFLIFAEGVIGHGVTTQEIVGNTDVTLDCLRSETMEFVTPNGLGQRIFNEASVAADWQNPDGSGFEAAGPAIDMQVDDP
jgi:hypothetical protein